MEHVVPLRRRWAILLLVLLLRCPVVVCSEAVYLAQITQVLLLPSFLKLFVLFLGVCFALSHRFFTKVATLVYVSIFELALFNGI